ncbi:MAG: hypothetical protein II943_00915 [Victivallales bacterium]|nr:hypothetical protein [Victivallales bacterium]
MFSPTFQDWPRPNRLLFYVLLLMFAAALLVLYLYVMPKWHQYQKYQHAIQEKEERLAGTPWPQDVELLRQQYAEVRKKLDGDPETAEIGLVLLTDDILHQATSTFEERILSQFDSPQHFINAVSRIDYKDAYDHFAQELEEQKVTLDPTNLGLGEDTADPVWQMTLKLWTAQQICHIAREHHLAILSEDGIAAINALPPIAYTVEDTDTATPYLLEFPVRVKLKGRLEDFLLFAQSLSTSICFLPLKQLEIQTLPPDPPLPGKVNTVDTAIFNMVCSSFLQPRSSEFDMPIND